MRLIVAGSQNAIVLLFAFEQTDHLSRTVRVTAPDLTTTSITPFLEFTLPRNILRLRNLSDLTRVHLELIGYEMDLRPRMDRTIVILGCSTADRETLHIEVEYSLKSSQSPITIGTDFLFERILAMRVLNYLRPLDLGKVIELRMEGFVGEWGLEAFELYDFLQYMSALRHIKTSDDNGEIFWSALSMAKRSVPVVVEKV